MKKINFGNIFKIFAILATVYFLYIMSIIASNMENGRYQFKTDSSLILDTKTGMIYRNYHGQLIEIK